ncbi:hypothetical protein K502DRAFT_103736 [Neoconidiobolus thromboides FSU 785]|nr:hypothetical protein K502DRAFT_103736 [Neoconidiobolus thromboides FSU 785]
MTNEDIELIKTVYIEPIFKGNEINELLPSIELISKLLNNRIIYKNKKELIINNLPLINGNEIQCELKIKQEFSIAKIDYNYTKVYYEISNNNNNLLFYEKVKLLESLPNDNNFVFNWFDNEGKKMEDLIKLYNNNDSNNDKDIITILLNGEAGIGKSLFIAQLSKLYNIQCYNTNALKLNILNSTKQKFHKLIQSIIEDKMNGY